jgi:hypothetical protein
MGESKRGQQLGEIAALLKSAYDDGIQYGRNHAE